ncbi:unnamed protein product [Tuber aestivum]|uniref:Uncharacterized protein n=1 Tax=Tuber aestivum TaxID=59557 RepID=A0A292PKL1_9PEZI|nr:unnamed protein product [Tuber aestivum]
MPKRRLPPIRSNKRKKKLPETSEEFLDAGIELEESGDRWRAGDKVKAGRFYIKAIESYEAALQRNQWSFDATYNRARLQYQLAQHPNLLPTPSDVTPRSLLEKAVQSHRECLVLNPENQDALFNTGQVLCSLAEALVEYRNTPVEVRSEASNFLCEAVEVFQKCLQVQESQHASLGLGNGTGTGIGDEGDTDMDADEPPSEHENPVPSEGGQGDDDQMSEGSGSGSAQWVIVQTPVTLTQILDTALAQLDACASLLPLCAVASLGGKSLSWAQSMGETLISSKIIPLSQEIGREQDVALAKANFGVSLGEASFRAGLTDLAGWEAAIHLAFPNSEGTAQGFQELCDKADAHIQLASAASEKTEEGGAAANLAWRHYALSAKSLSAAAKLEPAKSEIHIARGDVEILRAKLSVPAAAESRDVLVKNAGVYYRGAKRLEGDARIRIEAAVKEAMVAFEGGDGGELLKGIEPGPIVKEVVVEAVDEGLFSADWLSRVSS